MKYLIMCEGQNELTIIDVLLDAHALKIERDYLLGLSAYHARQIERSPQVKSALSMYMGKDIAILRVGDKMSDKLIVPKAHKESILEIKKYCTKPEIEILLIIAENLYSRFQSEKSSIHPKQFAKQNIKWWSDKRKRYDGSCAFYEDYFGSRVDLLVNVIKQYRLMNGGHKKDELYLADLLK